jgi:hypothetical protein
MSNSTGVKRSPSTSTEVLKQAVRRAPTDEEIRQRAYEIYLSRNGGPGNEFKDWLQAERELHSK